MQWQASIAPLVTILIGFCFFLAPKRLFSHLHIEGVERHAEAFGEGRSTFAGFLIAGGALAFATRDPLVLFLLGLAWGVAAFGKLLHMTIDRGRSKSVALRFLMALMLAGFLLALGSAPQILFQNSFQLSNVLPMISAIVTFLFGVMCLFLPKTSLSIMRLRNIEGFASSVGEVRGNVAGFYLAAAVGVMFIGNIYALLFLGVGWLVTAFGRVISMLSDGTNNMFNWISLIIEFSLSALPLVIAFGLIQ